MITIDDIFTVLAGADAVAYDGHDGSPQERVSQLAHALQCARHAEQAGAGDGLVAASLLHDIGHLLGDDDHGGIADHRHDAIAAAYLEQIFPASVVNPVALHVQAKRYLCAVEPHYAAELSPASVHSLACQGGAFDAAAASAFLAQDHAVAAVELRRWDDLSKVPGTKTRLLEDYRDLLDSLVRPG